LNEHGAVVIHDDRVVAHRGDLKILRYEKSSVFQIGAKVFRQFDAR
jgi:hypothetical protein